MFERCRFSYLNAILLNRYFTSKLEQRIFLEDDPNSNCVEYEESTYEDCDNDYIHRMLKEKCPPGFMPVWATEDTANVTTYLETKSLECEDSFQEILTGTEESGRYLISILMILTDIFRLSAALYGDKNKDNIYQ